MPLGPGGKPIIYNLPGFDRMKHLESIFISQKVELLEMITGCETPNRYKVYEATKSGKDSKGNPIFLAEEKSGCCARMCLSGECRPFKVHVLTKQYPEMSGGDTRLDKEPFLLIDRPCKCTCYCIGRPIINIYDATKTAEADEAQNYKNFVGKIKDPWNLCDLVVEVQDVKGDIIYKIDGSCCQLGLWCKWPCEACQTISFDIKNKAGDKRGDCVKRSKGCLLAALGSDADNFNMNFPPESNETERAILMCAIIFMDFRFFEENPNNKKKRGGILGNG